MTLTPETRAYRRGDLASLNCEWLWSDEHGAVVQDWPTFAELRARDIRSLRLGDELLACFGFFLCAPREADCFAVLDRERCKGYGAELAEAIRNQQLKWMQEEGVDVSHADCSSGDRAARVFLRAIGFRQVASPNPATTMFRFERSF